MKKSKPIIILEKIDIQPLISTRDFLAEALQVAENKFEIAGAVQAFEVCYELAWKTCKKVISLRVVVECSDHFLSNDFARLL